MPRVHLLHAVLAVLLFCAFLLLLCVSPARAAASTTIYIDSNHSLLSLEFDGIDVDYFVFRANVSNRDLVIRNSRVGMIAVSPDVDGAFVFSNSQWLIVNSTVAIHINTGATWRKQSVQVSNWSLIVSDCVLPPYKTGAHDSPFHDTRVSNIAVRIGTLEAPSLPPGERVRPSLIRFARCSYVLPPNRTLFERIPPKDLMQWNGVLFIVTNFRGAPGVSFELVDSHFESAFLVPTFLRFVVESAMSGNIFHVTGSNFSMVGLQQQADVAALPLLYIEPSGSDTDVALLSNYAAIVFERNTFTYLHHVAPWQRKTVDAVRLATPLQNIGRISFSYNTLVMEGPFVLDLRWNRTVSLNGFAIMFGNAAPSNLAGGVIDVEGNSARIDGSHNVEFVALYFSSKQRTDIGARIVFAKNVLVSEWYAAVKGFYFHISNASTIGDVVFSDNTMHFVMPDIGRCFPGGKLGDAPLSDPWCPYRGVVVPEVEEGEPGGLLFASRASGINLYSDPNHACESVGSIELNNNTFAGLALEGAMFFFGWLVVHDVKLMRFVGNTVNATQLLSPGPRSRGEQLTSHGGILLNQLWWNIDAVEVSNNIIRVHADSISDVAAFALATMVTDADIAKHQKDGARYFFGDVLIEGNRFDISKLSSSTYDRSTSVIIIMQFNAFSPGSGTVRIRNCHLSIVTAGLCSSGACNCVLRGVQGDTSTQGVLSIEHTICRLRGSADNPSHFVAVSSGGAMGIADVMADVKSNFGIRNKPAVSRMWAGIEIINCTLFVARAVSFLATFLSIVISGEMIFAGPVIISGATMIVEEGSAAATTLVGVLSSSGALRVDTKTGLGVVCIATFALQTGVLRLPRLVVVNSTVVGAQHLLWVPRRAEKVGMAPQLRTSAVIAQIVIENVTFANATDATWRKIARPVAGFCADDVPPQPALIAVDDVYSELQTSGLMRVANTRFYGVQRGDCGEAQGSASAIAVRSATSFFSNLEVVDSRLMVTCRAVLAPASGSRPPLSLSVFAVRAAANITISDSVLAVGGAAGAVPRMPAATLRVLELYSAGPAVSSLLIASVRNVHVFRSRAAFDDLALGTARRDDFEGGGALPDSLVAVGTSSASVAVAAAAFPVPGSLLVVSCLFWQGEPVFRGDGAVRAAGRVFARYDVVPHCGAAVMSRSATASDSAGTRTRGRRGVNGSSDTRSGAATATETVEPALAAPGLSDRALAGLTTTGTVTMLIANVVATNPSALLGMLRGQGQMRLALCAVRGMRRSVPQALAANLSAEVMAADLEFPRLLLPGLRLGARAGASYRAAVAADLLCLALCVAAGLFVATASRARWAAYVREQHRQRVRDGVVRPDAPEPQLGGDDDNGGSGGGTAAFFPYDRFVFKPILLMIAFVCGVSGALIAAKPAGGGDVALGLAPLLLIGGVAVACARRVYCVASETTVAPILKQMPREQLLRHHQHREGRGRPRSGDAGGGARRFFGLDGAGEEHGEEDQELHEMLLSPAQARSRAGPKQQQQQQQQRNQQQALPVTPASELAKFVMGDVLDERRRTALMTRGASPAVGAGKDGSPSHGVQQQQKSQSSPPSSPRLTAVPAATSSASADDVLATRLAGLEERPVWYCEPSGVFVDRRRTAAAWRAAHRFVQGSVLSRLFLIGRVVWMNPYVDLEHNVVRPGPGPRTQFALLFNAYCGPTKVYVDDMTAKQRAAFERLQRESDVHRRTASSPSSRRSFRLDTRALASGEPDSAVVGRASSRDRKRERDRDRGRKAPIAHGEAHNRERSGREIQKNLSPSAPTVRAAGHYYDVSLRLRCAAAFVFANMLLTVVIATLAGTSDVDPDSCRGNFFVALVFSLAAFPAVLWLRPYIVPWRNAAVIALEACNFFGACIFAGVVAGAGGSMDDAESYIAAAHGEIVAAEILSTAPAAVIGPAMMALGMCRSALFVLGKMKLVTRTELRQHIARELSRLAHLGLNASELPATVAGAVNGGNGSGTGGDTDAEADKKEDGKAAKARERDQGQSTSWFMQLF